MLDNWASSAPSKDEPTYAGTGVSLSAGLHQIQIDYFDATGTSFLYLYLQSPDTPGGGLVPSDWLYPEAALLPSGWALSTPLNGGLAMTSARVSESAVTIIDATGAGHVFTRSADGTTFTAPEEAQNSTLSEDADGLLTLLTAGTVYVFNADGTLKSATTALDDRQPAAARFDWVGTPPRLDDITDPVSNRTVTLRYGGSGSCGTPPAGLTTAPGRDVVPGRVLGRHRHRPVLHLHLAGRWAVGTHRRPR